MKYFTRGYISGELADAEAERIGTAYQQHIQVISDFAPVAIADLSKTNLHDGLIRRVVVKHNTNELLLSLRCGDLQVGYFDLELLYSGVSLDIQLLKVLSRRAHDKQTEILADEIDAAADGRFVHRLLFWPEDEISITFANLRLTRQAQPDRKISCTEEPYVEIIE